ncbi:hypothetical protein A7985_00610 [Pseudoalteromonas luteoviolacea]|uniref:Uncharacterized protein n=1 Tax=Pseudoalteromonas luteoviolacea TaxID=43657 RepID=A0A1C0TT54_9GAMM|nr:hypothetical protein [Pseudoalteromonas luteoviolacea]OCQ22503.1 hypothetical protein A7985_00610 [Pseudoalteromonas luteoviolacea]
MKLLLAIGAVSLVLSAMPTEVKAGTCEIKYLRTACPGKEKISYKKCKGKQRCSKFKEAATAAECGEMAVKSCRNKRLTITKSKVITALFDGQQIKASNGSEDFCTVYAKASEEFNKCGG